MSDKIDMEFLRQITGGDAEFEKELFGIFRESSKSNMEKMEKAIEGQSDNDWHMAAHAFKGAAASIGAFDLSKMLEKAQHHPKGIFEEKKQLLNSIKAEFGVVDEFMKKQEA